MRKLIIVLLLAVSFALGMVSQNLVAGNWVVPKFGTPAPTLNATFHGNYGWVQYNNLHLTGWKVVKAGLTNHGDLGVQFMKLE